MAMTIYAKITGEKNIPGDCTQQGREDTIICYSLDHIVDIPRDTHSGLPTGQRIHRPVKITTHIGKHTPLLFDACTSGTRLKVEFKFFRINEKGKEEEYYKVELTNAIVVETREWFPTTFIEENKAYKHMQDVSFTYEAIKWTATKDGTEADDSWTKPKS